MDRQVRTLSAGPNRILRLAFILSRSDVEQVDVGILTKDTLDVIKRVQHGDMLASGSSFGKRGPRAMEAVSTVVNGCEGSFLALMKRIPHQVSNMSQLVEFNS